MKTFNTLLYFSVLTSTVLSNPLVNSWLTESSGKYARIYRDNNDLVSQTSVTTWSRGQGSQILPTYAGVHEIAQDNDNVYIRTTNLGFHVMGPWFGETGNLFPNYPANTADIFSFPRIANTNHSPKTPTAGGAIGYFVDGVAMFDSRDAFSYSNFAGVDEQPQNQNTVNGDNVWLRDAFINEGITFDNAFAHSAGPTYHYHANPPALRYQVGDSVSYDLDTNTYSEVPNGKHSPILGWCRDGLPIYGPYGYSDPTDSSSSVRRMITGYQKRDGTNGSTNLVQTGRTTLPQWVVRNEGGVATLPSNLHGPAVDAVIDGETYILGRYLQDYAYKGDLTGFDLYEGVLVDGPHNPATDYDLNEYNVRFTVTPDFPNGTWAYFTNIASDGTPIFPYNIARYYFAEPTGNSPTSIPVTATTVWEGGPEKQLKVRNLDVEEANGDVTLTWDSTEGGIYTISQSPTLSNWQFLAEKNGTDAFTQITDRNRTNNESKHFYQIALDSILPFDDNGFVYDNSNVLPPPQNNILLLILDDWGIDASELYNTEAGAQLANMPHLRSLLFSNSNANPTDTPDKGLLFTRGYAQPICSPTRATLLTGRQPYQHGVGNPTTDNTLPSSELTFPEIITTEAPDYGLASFGKWHLGSGTTGPLDTGGWPNFSGTLGGGLMTYDSWSRVEIENSALTDTGTNLTNTYATSEQVNEAISFINTQATAPWIVWMGFNAPHTPFHDPSPYVTPTNGYFTSGTANRDLYIRMLEALDHEIGNLLAAVDLTKTNVIVVGDNGTPGQVDQAPASGIAEAKGSLNEGGIHVPFFASGPDILVAGKNDTLVHVSDLFSTILEIANVNVSIATSGIDLHSTSLLPIFKGTDMHDRCIISEVFNQNANDGRAIILDNWPEYKLIARHDVSDPTDTPTYEMYQIGSNGVEFTTLTVPPPTGALWEDAYNALVAKDQSLQPPPPTTTTTVYLRMATTTGPASPPPARGIQPTQITYQNNDVATIEGRLDPNANDAFGRYWVKVTINGNPTIDTNDFSAFFITFPDNTNQTPSVAREFIPVEIIVAP